MEILKWRDAEKVRRPLLKEKSVNTTVKGIFFQHEMVTLKWRDYTTDTQMEGNVLSNKWLHIHEAIKDKNVTSWDSSREQPKRKPETLGWSQTTLSLCPYIYRVWYVCIYKCARVGIVILKAAERGLKSSSCPTFLITASMPSSVHCTVMNASEGITDLKHLRPGQYFEPKPHWRRAFRYQSRTDAPEIRSGSCVRTDRHIVICQCRITPCSGGP